MNLRTLFSLVVIGLSLSAQPVEASYSASQRAAIRATPITQRPHRAGHVYGNTVRALNRARAW